MLEGRCLEKISPPSLSVHGGYLFGENGADWARWLKSNCEILEIPGQFAPTHTPGHERVRAEFRKGIIFLP